MTFYVSNKTIEDSYERFRRFNEQQKPSMKNLPRCTLLRLKIKAALNKIKENNQ